MKDDTLENTTRICPKCRKEYRGIPATSRTDGETMICPDCGIREALQSIGIEKEEQEKILRTIHKYGREKQKIEQRQEVALKTIIDFSSVTVIM